MDVSILLTAFGVVFIAEIIGDKSIYTISSLASRFNIMAVLLGLSAAYCLKMAVAVVFGQVLAELPTTLLAGISAVTFFATAIFFWLKKTDGNLPEKEISSFSGSTAVSFASVFFIEWADFGQISAAALTAQYGYATSVWLGGSLALIVKGVIAVTLGLTLRRYLPYKLIHYSTVCMCFVMGFMSIWHLASSNYK